MCNMGFPSHGLRRPWKFSGLRLYEVQATVWTVVKRHCCGEMVSVHRGLVQKDFSFSPTLLAKTVCQRVSNRKVPSSRTASLAKSQFTKPTQNFVRVVQYNIMYSVVWVTVNEDRMNGPFASRFRVGRVNWKLYKRVGVITDTPHRLLTTQTGCVGGGE